MQQFPKMKARMFLAVVCVCAMSIYAKATVAEGQRNSKALSDAIARAIAQHMALEMMAKDIRIPVLPPLDDPLDVENAELNLTELGIDGLVGTIVFRDGRVTGLSTIIDDQRFNISIPARPSIIYKLTAGILKARGQYEANVNLNGSTLVGAGSAECHIKNPDLEVDVRLIVNLLIGPVIVHSVDIKKVQFDKFKGIAEGLLFNGEPVDWKAFNAHAKELFEEFWAENEIEIEARVKPLLADALKGCKIPALIGGDYSCIAFPESSRVTNSRLVTEIIKYIA